MSEDIKTNQLEEPGKPAFFSTTIWAVIVAVLSVLVPDVVPQLEGTIADVIALLSMLVAAWGRLRASKAITSWLPKL